MADNNDDDEWIQMIEMVSGEEDNEEIRPEAEEASEDEDAHHPEQQVDRCPPRRSGQQEQEQEDRRPCCGEQQKQKEDRPPNALIGLLGPLSSSDDEAEVVEATKAPAAFASSIFEGKADDIFYGLLNKTNAAAAGHKIRCSIQKFLDCTCEPTMVYKVVRNGEATVKMFCPTHSLTFEDFVKAKKPMPTLHRVSKFSVPDVFFGNNNLSADSSEAQIDENAKKKVTFDKVATKDDDQRVVENKDNTLPNEGAQKDFYQKNTDKAVDEGKGNDNNSLLFVLRANIPKSEICSQKNVFGKCQRGAFLRYTLVRKNDSPEIHFLCELHAKDLEENMPPGMTVIVEDPSPSSVTKADAIQGSESNLPVEKGSSGVDMDPIDPKGSDTSDNKPAALTTRSNKTGGTWQVLTNGEERSFVCYHRDCEYYAGERHTVIRADGSSLVRNICQGHAARMRGENYYPSGRDKGLRGLAWIRVTGRTDTTLLQGTCTKLQKNSAYCQNPPCRRYDIVRSLMGGTKQYCLCERHARTFEQYLMSEFKGEKDIEKLDEGETDSETDENLPTSSDGHDNTVVSKRVSERLKRKEIQGNPSTLTNAPTTRNNSLYKNDPSLHKLSRAYRVEDGKKKPSDWKHIFLINKVDFSEAERPTLDTTDAAGAYCTKCKTHFNYHWYSNSNSIRRHATKCYPEELAAADRPVTRRQTSEFSSAALAMSTQIPVLPPAMLPPPRPHPEIQAGGYNYVLQYPPQLGTPTAQPHVAGTSRLPEEARRPRRSRSRSRSPSPYRRSDRSHYDYYDEGRHPRRRSR